MERGSWSGHPAPSRQSERAGEGVEACPVRVVDEPRILAAIEHGLSNGRIESVNTKIRLISRVTFGFRSPEALIALAMLNLGGHRPALPGRT